MESKQLNFAVAGNPVSHSLSPVLFQKYHEHQDLNLVYSRILATSAEEIISIARAFDLRGLNITAPFKKKITAFADSLSAYVKETGVSNTLCFNKNNIKAFNTDISGVQMSLTKQVSMFNISCALVVGSGGAATASLKALSNIRIRDIYILSRNFEEGARLADKYNAKILIDPDFIDSCDLVINTTPVIPVFLESIVLSENALLFDADYVAAPMKQFAQDNGLNYSGGIEWLINQGRAAYLLMTGVVNNRFSLAESDWKLQSFNSQRVALIGMMASGKSTIGRRLAEKLGFTFADTDKIIEEIEGMSITDIFKNKGESYFREMESDVLQNLIIQSNIVISTGGGIINSEQNINMLKENCWNILLHSSPENLVERTTDKNRPLLEGYDKRKTLEELFNKRRDSYFKASDVIVNTENDSFSNISEMIYEDFNHARLRRI